MRLTPEWNYFITGNTTGSNRSLRNSVSRRAKDGLKLQFPSNKKEHILNYKHNNCI